MIYQMVHEQLSYEEIFKRLNNTEKNKKRNVWKKIFPKC